MSKKLIGFAIGVFLLMCGCSTAKPYVAATATSAATKAAATSVPTAASGPTKTQDPLRVPAFQTFAHFKEVDRLLPIPCFNGGESPYMFAWESTAPDKKSITAFVSQSKDAPPVSLRDGDPVTVEWCGTRAEVGVLVIRNDDKGGIEVLIDNYKKPVILLSSTEVPSWPSPQPTTPSPTVDPNKVSTILTFDWVKDELKFFNVHVVNGERNATFGTCRIVVTFKNQPPITGWENDCAILADQPLQFKLEEWQEKGKFGDFQQVVLEVRREGGWEAAKKVDLTEWFADVVREFPTSPATPKAWYGSPKVTDTLTPTATK